MKQEYKDRIQKEWLKRRARPHQWKWVSYNNSDLPKLKENVKTKVIDENTTAIYILPGYCPCAECNHQYMWECGETDRFGHTNDCCSNICT